MAIVMTLVTIISHYDKFSRSKRNVKSADILNHTVNVLYILVYCSYLAASSSLRSKVNSKPRYKVLL